MKYFSWVLTLCMLVFLSTHAQAADAYSCPNSPPSEVYNCHLRHANDNIASAQEWVGDYYFTGQYTDPNYPKAEEWYLKAAENGQVRAQIRLGFMYAENHFPGIENNLEKGEYWFQQAANQNTPEGLFRLGNFYHHYLKPPNYEKTLFWLEKAAELNYGAAQYDLARIYQSDKIPEQKPDLALKHMEAAANNGIRQAQMALANHYENEGNYTKALDWASILANGKGRPFYWRNKVRELKTKMLMSPQIQEQNEEKN